jgi:hypothetical protein
MMNERLKELLKQSGAYDYYEVNEGVEGDEKPMEKFAELIVKECIDTLNWHGVDDGVPYIEYMAKSKLGVMK